MKLSFGTLDANLWRWQFLRNLRQQVRRRGLDSNLIRCTAERAQVLFNENRCDAPDKQGIAVVGINALVLAGYRELVSAGVSRTVAFDTMRDTFRGCFSGSTRLSVRVVMALCRDPVLLLRRVRLSRVFGALFGRMFTFEDRNTEEGVELRITKCGSHEFFVSQGEPLLTRILCEWDHNWLGPIQSSRHSVNVERPVTMATTGAEHCEFHIRRAGKVRAEGKKTLADVTVQGHVDVIRVLGELDKKE